MSQMEHCCLDCKWMGFDNEILKVCPMCSSSNITNIPDESWDRDEDKLDEHGRELFI